MVFSPDEERKVPIIMEETASPLVKTPNPRSTQLAQDYPPISFDNPEEIWSTFARGILLMKESRGFKEELLVSHQLFDYPDMRMTIKELKAKPKKRRRLAFDLMPKKSLEEQYYENMVTNLEAFEAATQPTQERLPESQIISAEELPADSKPQLDLQLTEVVDAPEELSVPPTADLPEEQALAGAMRTPSNKAKAKRSASINYYSLSPVAPHFTGMNSHKTDANPGPRRGIRRRSYAG